MPPTSLPSHGCVNPIKYKSLLLGLSTLWIFITTKHVSSQTKHGQEWKKELGLEQIPRRLKRKKNWRDTEFFKSMWYCDVMLTFFFWSYFFLSFGGKLIIDGVNMAGVGKGRKLNLGKTTWPVTLKRFWQKLQNHQEAAWLSG